MYIGSEFHTAGSEEGKLCGPYALFLFEGEWDHL